LLERLPDDEVAAICAHELGHLAESKLTVSTRVFANLALLVPWLFLKPLGHAFGGAGIGAIALGSLLTLFGARWFGRQLEERADRIAHTNEGETGTYARALARLYEDNLIPAVLPRRRRTHPDLYDRLLAAGVQPDFPRPAAPSSIANHVVVLLLLLGVLIGLTLARLYP
jgi:Zn-dependent protease with chaperone function